MKTNCAPLVCTINGNARPDVDLSPMEFYGLSEYYYSLHDVMTRDEPYYKYEVMAPKVKVSRTYCGVLSVFLNPRR